MKRIKKTQRKYIWKDRKRHLGLPLSFIRYRASEDRLFLETRLWRRSYDEIMLYRVQDISFSIDGWQRIFGVGTGLVNASDKTLGRLWMYNVKQPREVTELLHRQVEKAKLAYRVRYNEMMGGGPGGSMGMSGPGDYLDMDGDGIPDILED